MTETRQTTEIGVASVLRRCGACDVTWRGTPDTTCWVCSSPGVPATQARIVEDEPAA